MSANFTPSLNVYTDLTPFRFWCQKVLPLAYDDSLSYYELLCKVVDYLNKTMEDVSLSIEDVEKLHAAYVSLQGYVNNYFNNLDVQEEINNKLDALVADGTIHEIFTPDVTAILNVARQASLDAIAAIPGEVTDWLDDNISQETGYVIDNTLTVSGAAADAKVTGDKIGELKSEIDALIEAGYNPVNSADITIINSRYVTIEGVLGNASWGQLYAFDTVPGRIYFIASLSTGNVPNIYFDDTAYPNTTQSGNRYMAVAIVGDGTRVRINNAAVDGVAVQAPIIMVNDFLPYTDNVAKNTDELTAQKETKTTTERAGYYITAAGVQGTLGGYNLQSFIAEKDKVYFIETEIKTAQAGTVPLFYSDGTPYGLNSKKGTFVFVGNGRTVYVNTYTDFEWSVQEYKFTNYVWSPDFIGMYNNIVCCGDSLTYGLVYNTASTYRKANSAYPETMQKLTGCTVTSLAVSGYDPSEWWADFADEITGKNKLYIIYLGTNGQLTDTVDTDCAGDDYTQYANTDTGNYGKIIRKILDTDSRCILVKVAMGSYVSVSNQVLDAFSAKFGVPVVENPARGSDSPLNNMYYHYGDDTTYWNTVHMNDLGYATFASMLLDNIRHMSLEDQYKIMPR